MAGVSVLIQKLERLGGDQVKSAIARKVADAAHKACIRGFVEQRDPYGVPWKPRKDPRGNWPILDKTNGPTTLTSRAFGERASLRIVDIYKFHQSGTKYMVARKVFPEPALGLGLWQKPIEDASLEAVRELMR